MYIAKTYPQNPVDNIKPPISPGNPDFTKAFKTFVQTTFRGIQKSNFWNPKVDMGNQKSNGGSQKLMLDLKIKFWGIQKWIRGVPKTIFGVELSTWGSKY